MPPHIALLGAIADVLAFLGPADQHKLRCTSAAMCEWFDSAAENGSLAFFVTYEPILNNTTADPLRWKHATADARGAGPEQEADNTPPRATVTVHARNYCLSTYNGQTQDQADDSTVIDNANIELVADFAFEHKLVVAGLFGIRSIGDGFCKGLKAVEIEFRGEGSQLVSVGYGWISTCKKLKHIRLSGFTALEEVGGNWLSNCSSLESVVFAGNMPKLTTVSWHWLSNCPKLKHVDLSGFTALETVNDYWLCYSGLESIAFTGMPKLKKVRWVTDGWMSHCSSLESITFAADMPKLKKVGDKWMSYCEKLKHIDLTGFTALEEVGNHWMASCSSLVSVTFAVDMRNLKKVGHKWTPQSDCSLSDHLLHLSKSGYY